MKGKVCGDFCEFTLDKGHFITGDIFAKRQQRNKEENTDRMRPSLFGAGV